MIGWKKQKGQRRRSGAILLCERSSQYDKDETWGSVTKTSIKSVIAQSGVRFVGDCSGLFYNFSACETMDLSLVDTSGMTSAKGMFAKCASLTAPIIKGWNTAQVMDMSLTKELSSIRTFSTVINQIQSAQR